MLLRLIAFALLLGSAIHFVSNYNDEKRGVTVVRAFTSRSLPEVVSRADHPQDFANAMFYQWIEASAFLLLSLILFGFIKRADRLDPMSPNFKGNDALDELEEELDRERRRRDGR